MTPEAREAMRQAVAEEKAAIAARRQMVEDFCAFVRKVNTEHNHKV